MNLGAKIFGIKDKKFLDEVAGSIDFIEVMAIRSQNYDFLKDYEKKIVIHAEHQLFGINPADSAKYSKNLKSIEFAMNLADSLNAKKIVCHPGAISNSSCSEEIAINFFRKIDDRRILVENLPPLNYQGRAINSLCSVPEKTENFLKKTGKNLCLDISHAILSALARNKTDYNEFIKPYLELNPAHFHFSDILLEKKRDHLHLGEGNLDIGYYRKILPKNADITLETRNKASKLLDDIGMLKS
ncbi:MAG: TIM barrel protein [archaeon]